MRLIALSVMLLVISSCANKKAQKENLENKIMAQEAKSLNEIKKHYQQVLNSHPELSSETKKEIKDYFDSAIETQQKLKDEESKVVQLLLNKSFRETKLTSDEEKLKKNLKKRLSDIYKNKADNIFSLLSRISALSEKGDINEEVRRDMIFIFRELR